MLHTGACPSSTRHRGKERGRSYAKGGGVTSADVCLSSPAAKSRIEASETKFAWSAQRLSPVSRPATNSGDNRRSKSLSNIKESLYKSKERTEE